MVAFGGDAEEWGEGGLWGFSSIEAKDELIQVALEMRLAEGEVVWFIWTAF